MRRTVRRHVAALLGFVGVLTALLGLASVPAASAASAGGDVTLPAGLEKYVPGSAAWANSPWMTSPACAGRGGDFSQWTASVIADTPLLLEHFQPRSFGSRSSGSDQARSDAIIAGYRKLNTTIRSFIPGGYCVSDIAAWTTGSAAQAPFEFTWGSSTSGNHQSMYSCTSEHPGAANDKKPIGADRAMCDGFFLDCARPLLTDAQQRCAAWNTFSDDYVRRVNELRHAAISAHPAVVERASVDTVAAPSGSIGALLRWGWLGLVAAFVAVVVVVGLGLGISRRRSQRGR